MTQAAFTREEIYSQPQAWKDALDVLANHASALEALAKGGYSQVIFTGCGSTYYLAMAAASLLQELSGQPSRALPASELWLYPHSSYPPGKVLLVPVSRSGYTTETLRACETFLADRRGDLLTISTDASQPLANFGHRNVVLPSGAERSVAQTRAFSTLYLGCVALALFWSGRRNLFAELDRLPDAAEQVIQRCGPLAAHWGRDLSLDRFYFLGSGLRYGLACELSLKMKEMTLTHSEPFHFLEFRHGPKSMMTPSTLMVGLLSERHHAAEAAVLQDMRGLGANTFSIGETGSDVAFHSMLDESIRNILALPVGQILAFERALAKDLDPDQPQNLSSVIVL